MKGLKQETLKKTESIKQLETNMESLQHQNSNHSGSLEGFMGGIKGISELEAQLQFREKEFQELKM